MTLLNTSLLTHALKEWAIAVETLTSGKTIVLLRKGGIREAGFQVKHDFVWLYPTYEHQKPNLLKPEYNTFITPVESGWHPETVNITSCANITHVLPIHDPQTLQALQPYHIWNQQMVSDRTNWQPQNPLIVLLLKVYRLPQPQIIPYHPSYGGCKSWIDLMQPISTENLSPVLTDDEYNRQVLQIQQLIQ
ncbi:hypothetical protein NIES4102_15410 [Chondrocystis sp. NIES-4102]|nr:hypothetical protein NIES4102_15410 [Chondrocystis sp. NIES-4102]